MDDYSDMTDRQLITRIVNIKGEEVMEFIKLDREEKIKHLFLSTVKFQGIDYTSLKKGQWIGVDLDGTLAKYDGWISDTHIGDPIKPMADRVKLWVSLGVEVRIFTARVDGGEPAMSMGISEGLVFRNVDRIINTIQCWTLEHLGIALPVTNRKDFGMVELWDDRAVRIIPNFGTRCCGG